MSTAIEGRRAILDVRDQELGRAVVSSDLCQHELSLVSAKS